MESPRRPGALDVVRGAIMGFFSLRFAVYSLLLLLAAALGVSYLLEEDRREAQWQREEAHLRLHVERAADEIARRLFHLRDDLLFLAHLPALRGLQDALAGGDGKNALGQSPNLTADQWRAILGQTLRAFVGARPEYTRVRLLSVPARGHEFLRLERADQGLVISTPEAPPSPAEIKALQTILELPPGALRLSRISPAPDGAAPQVPTNFGLQAATPLLDPQGNCFGALVVNLDGPRFIEGITSHAETHAYVLDDRGGFLLYPPDPTPDPAHALDVLFPEWASHLEAPASTGGDLPRHGPGAEQRTPLLAVRPLHGFDGLRHLLVLMREGSPVPTWAGAGTGSHVPRLHTLLWLALVFAALFLTGRLVRLTQSLRRLSRATEEIAAGHYDLALPKGVGGEVTLLTQSFARMVQEVRSRERARAALTHELEQRVAARTEELRRNQMLQQLILDSIGDGVVVVDRDGRFMHWNRAAERLLGLGPVTGLAPEDWPRHFGYYHSEALEPVAVEALPLVRAMRTGESSQMELYVSNARLPQGRWVLARGHPLRSAQGELEGGIATLIDVTEQRSKGDWLREHQAELTKVGRFALLGEFVSALSHQLSQPLAAIANYAGASTQMLRSGKLNLDRLGEILNHIVRLADRAGKSLHDIRELTRQGAPTRVLVDINPLVDNCLQLLEPRWRRDGINVETHLSSGLRPVRADPIELEQAFIHVLINGLDALREVPPERRQLGVHTQPGTGDEVLIRITDTGLGLGPEIADQVFEPWVTNKAGAMGIGLAITRTLIEGYEGRIWINRTDQAETEVRIVLPGVATTQGP